MIPQFDNKVMTSFSLFLDHRVVSSGRAFYNQSGLFYPTHNKYSSRFTYALPHRQLVRDESISGADTMTGIYINNTLVAPGTSGLLNINHDKGTVTFDQNMDAHTLSGNYSVKEFNIYQTNSPEETLIYENKFFKKPRYSQTLTGLKPNEFPVPAIFLKKRGGSPEPFSLGGSDMSVIDIRVIVVTDDDFPLDVATSIMKDTHWRRFGLIEPDNLVFNYKGEYNATLGSGYNYTGIVGSERGNGNDGPLIRSVNESSVLTRGAYSDIKKNLKVSFVDFEVSFVRGH
jgi:hypothetical protein|tara:strand:+ start:328 stop:1185 length:858 start_codon:yes stop_codon:yes gene_type:complete